MNRQSIINGIVGGIMGLAAYQLWKAGHNGLGVALYSAWVVGLVNSMIPSGRA
jgi:hypothetical protein